MSQLLGSMTQLTLHSVPDPTISRIEALPQEIRHEILRYLLSTRYARLNRPNRVSKNANISHLQCYDWNVNMLRTCRTLYNDGIEILNRENKWIKIVLFMDAKTLYLSLANHDVHYIKQQSSAALSTHLADITISILRPGFGSTTSETILIPIEELRALCWYLRAMDLQNFFCFKFKFELHNKLPNALQRRILEPFSSVRGEAGLQQVDFKGKVHKVISARVSRAMTQPVGWLRTKGWDVYNIAKSIKAVADEAWLAKDYSMALHKYGQAVTFWDAAFENHTKLEDVDVNVDNARWHLDTICSINQVVATILSGDVTQSDRNEVDSMKHWIEDPRMQAVPSPLKALLAYATGVSLLIARQHKQASQCFQYALTLDATPSQASTFSQGLVVAKGFRTSPGSKRKADVKALVELLPRRPLPSPAVEPYISDLAAAEKFICTELGYTQKFSERIQEGISIRLVDSNNKPGKVIGLFPTSKPGELTMIDILEVLLHRRLRAMWRAERSSRRGPEPRLCQVGRVLPDRLQGRISVYRNQVAEADRLAIEHGHTPGHDIAVCKMWVSLSAERAGVVSASENEITRNLLLATWDACAPAAKEGIEMMVDALVRRHLVG